jgi:hypothetical protein
MKWWRCCLLVVSYDYETRFFEEKRKLRKRGVHDMRSMKDVAIGGGGILHDSELIRRYRLYVAV